MGEENVREKNSLCYYINSDVKPYDNIMFIYSGISNENIEKATKLIKKTIKEISSGKISDEILNIPIFFDVEMLLIVSIKSIVQLSTYCKSIAISRLSRKISS